MDTNFFNLRKLRQHLENDAYRTVDTYQVQAAMDAAEKLREAHGLGELWGRLVQTGGSWFLEFVGVRTGSAIRGRVRVFVGDPSEPLATVGSYNGPEPMELAVEILRGELESIKGTWPVEGTMKGVLELTYPGGSVEVPYEAARRVLPGSRVAHQA